MASALKYSIALEHWGPDGCSGARTELKSALASDLSRTAGTQRPRDRDVPIGDLKMASHKGIFKWFHC